MFRLYIIFSLILSTNLLFSQTGPVSINSGIKLWLDASDASTVYKDAGVTLAADGDAVRQWNDKSGNSAHVSQGTSSRRPIYVTSHANFHYKSVLDFDNTDNLIHSLSTAWSADYTFFIVLQSDDASPVTFESFFSSGDDKTNHNNFQVDYNAGNNKFRMFFGSQLNYGTFKHNEVKLYGITHHTDSIFIYDDGAKVSSTINVGTSLKGQRFNKYKVNINRANTNRHNSKIAEIIIYDRILDSCEMESILLYLGDKYGKDFLGLTAGYDYKSDFSANVNAICVFDSACVRVTKDTAFSGILTMHTPSSNDSLGEFAIIGNNGVTISASTKSADVPTGATERIGTVWAYDEDAPSPSGIGTVSLSFYLKELVDTFGEPLNTIPFKLITSTDQTSFATANGGSILSSTYTISGNTITFTGLTIPDGNIISLGWDLPTPLPVVLSKFEAKYNEQLNHVEINWTTSSEINNSHFEIEKSHDAIHWKTIKRVNGAGNSTSIIHYNIIDHSLSNDILYYRLKQVDFEGEYSYSKIEVVDLNIKDNDNIEVYPNPSSSIFYIKNIDRDHITLYDVFSNQYKINIHTDGKTRFINLDGFSNGVYFIKTGNETIKIEKVTQ